MTKEQIQTHKEAVQASLDVLNSALTEYLNELQEKLEEACEQTDLDERHLKAFAYCEDVNDIKALQEKLCHVAIFETNQREAFREIIHAVHIPNTSYKTNPKNPQVYWTQPKAQLVRERILNASYTQETLKEIFDEIEHLAYLWRRGFRQRYYSYVEAPLCKYAAVMPWKENRGLNETL